MGDATPPAAGQPPASDQAQGSEHPPARLRSGAANRPQPAGRPVDLELLGARIRDIPDYPKPGIVYKDITPLLLDPLAFAMTIDGLAAQVGGEPVDKVVGIEARGFIFAAPLAYQLGAGFIPARKAGKLPGDAQSVSYDLEYGAETLEIHDGSIDEGDRVWIVDDVLATGGTAAAAAALVEGFGGQVIGFGFLLELGFLDGAAALDGHRHASLLRS
jgi:adenine phosphoribosyltransferase